nr:heat shock factor-binding protein-like [Nicotiana tomentosiformis]
MTHSFWIILQDGHDADNTKQSTADMTVFVQNLLQQMQTRFQTMSESIISKIDEMGNRIDELEQSINDLRTEMGQEGSPSPSATLKSKDEPKSAEDST